MNPIEETLLMIFLESDSYISETRFKYCMHGFSHHWESFKQEELGRTLPEEFFVYTDDFGINFLNEGHRNLSLAICLEKGLHAKNKIKITIVEE